MDISRTYRDIRMCEAMALVTALPVSNEVGWTTLHCIVGRVCFLLYILIGIMVWISAVYDLTY